MRENIVAKEFEFWFEDWKKQSQIVNVCICAWTSYPKVNELALFQL